MTFSKLSWLKHMRGADLTDAEFRVLVLLVTYTDKNGTDAYPGNTRLADECGMHVRSVRRILHRLVAKGWIIEKSPGGNQYGKGIANVYELVAEPGKGDPTVPKGDPRVRKGDPTVPMKGDRGAPPSGPSHQGIASGPGHHSATDVAGSPHATSRRGVPNWEAMRDDFDLVEEWLSEEGWLQISGDYELAHNMWETGSHPLAILNTLIKQAS